jgi:hypothetical protein
MFILIRVAGLTGFEPATSAVTGRRSNQLSYNPNCEFFNLSKPRRMEVKITTAIFILVAGLGLEPRTSWL